MNWEDISTQSNGSVKVAEDGTVNLGADPKKGILTLLKAAAAAEAKNRQENPTNEPPTFAPPQIGSPASQPDGDYKAPVIFTVRSFVPVDMNLLG